VSLDLTGEPFPMTRHEAAISALCAYRHLDRMGFRKAVKAAMSYDPPDVENMDDADIALLPEPPSNRFPWPDVEGSLRVRPDAYDIREKEIHCYEVVDKNPITDDKRRCYAEAWFALDNFHIRLRLWVADIYGNLHEYNIANWFYLLAIPSGGNGPDGIQPPDEAEGVV
jgi:hypothetical protein